MARRQGATDCALSDAVVGQHRTAPMTNDDTPREGTDERSTDPNDVYERVQPKANAMGGDDPGDTYTTREQYRAAVRDAMNYNRVAFGLREPQTKTEREVDEMVGAVVGYSCVAVVVREDGSMSAPSFSAIDPELETELAVQSLARLNDAILGLTAPLGVMDMALRDAVQESMPAIGLGAVSAEDLVGSMGGDGDDSSDETPHSPGFF